MFPKDPTTIYRADTIDLVALWQVLWGYKYIVCLVATICVAVAIVLALTATPIYRAEVVVIPARQDSANDAMSLASRLGALANLTGINLSGNSGFSTNALAVLESRRLAEEFVTRKNLVTEFYPDAAQVPSLWFAVDRFRRTIMAIRTDNDRGTTTIAVNWTDPRVAATWANELVALANDLIRTQVLEEASRNIAYVNQQLDQTNQVELRRVLYNLIEAETQRVMLANARAEYAFTVVDPAVAPENRVSPRRTLMVLAGGVLGVILGAIVAFVHNAVRWSRVGGVPVSASDL